jgi:hypothetical protein
MDGNAPSVRTHISTVHGDGTCTCACCGQRVKLNRPSPVWYLGLVLIAAMVCLAFPLLAVMPPANMAMVPVMFFLVSSVVGFVSNGLGEDARCSHCKKYLVTRPSDATLRA